MEGVGRGGAGQAQLKRNKIKSNVYLFFGVNCRPKFKFTNLRGKEEGKDRCMAFFGGECVLCTGENFPREECIQFSCLILGFWISGGDLGLHLLLLFFSRESREKKLYQGEFDVSEFYSQKYSR